MDCKGEILEDVVVERIAPMDMMQGKVLEAELNEQAAKLETKRVQFQAWVDALWSKYGKIKGEDALNEDGTWTKVKK
jgi:hypothetical protein